MQERSFDEMIAYFNRRVADMDISQDCKMELLGMVTALWYKHEKTAQQWIPCSERLPEGIGRVIAQMDGGAIHDVFYKGKNPYGHVVWVRLDDCIYWDNEVVAWMPLPEPYKGVKE